MSQRILVVGSKNLTPQDEVNQKLASFKGNWKIISAQTSLMPHGAWDSLSPGGGYQESGRLHGEAWHIYYVTTVVIEQID